MPMRNGLFDNARISDKARCIKLGKGALSSCVSNLAGRNEQLNGEGVSPTDGAIDAGRCSCGWAHIWKDINEKLAYAPGVVTVQRHGE
ncbi:hypothetical protein HDG42_006462 [Paraburkholderia sp. JPY171]|nr:hypothetical protein [Paraburkholderia atlantica]